MNESYDVDSIIIGKIYVCKQLGSTYGIIENKTEEYYLFYRQGENHGKRLLKNNKIIKEVFTDDEYEIYNDLEKENNHIFNRPYIVDVQSITPYLTDQEIIAGRILKKRMVEIYNTINFSSKTKKK